MPNSAANPYDRVPYLSNPFPETHPWRLATVARLFGLQPTPIESCSVLELGCAVGGNLVPMAAMFPGARFHGIDSSARQIVMAQTAAGALGLSNIAFEQLSIADLTPDIGQFDYIICHGVFSWVPEAIRRAIFRVCRENLTPTGIAYVSFNTYPGCLRRRWARDMMLYHASAFATDDERIAGARSILKLMAGSPFADKAAGEVLKFENEHIANKPDEYVLHEYLGEVNEPMYFHEFAALADDHGLAYLGDARTNGTTAEESWPAAAQLFFLAANDFIRAEQYADFLRNRMFRRSLLVQKSAAIDRSSVAARMMEMHICSALRRDPDRKLVEAVAFIHPRGGGVAVALPATVAFLDTLGALHPQSLAFSDVCDRVKISPSQRLDVAADITMFWLTNLLEAYGTPPRFAVSPGEKPLASAVARYQAGEAGKVTNLRHEAADLVPVAKQFLALCDGTRNRVDLGRAIVQRTGRADLQAWGERALADFARTAFLVE